MRHGFVLAREFTRMNSDSYLRKSNNKRSDLLDRFRLSKG
jgi:hypothetical protein